MRALYDDDASSSLHLDDTNCQFFADSALPAIAIALAELMFDRNYGTNFFDFLEEGSLIFGNIYLDFWSPRSLF